MFKNFRRLASASLKQRLEVLQKDITAQKYYKEVKGRIATNQRKLSDKFEVYRGKLENIEKSNEMAKKLIGGQKKLQQTFAKYKLKIDTSGYQQKASSIIDGMNQQLREDKKIIDKAQSIHKQGNQSKQTSTNEAYNSNQQNNQRDNVREQSQEQTNQKSNSNEQNENINKTFNKEGLKEGFTQQAESLKSTLHKYNPFDWNPQNKVQDVLSNTSSRVIRYVFLAIFLYGLGSSTPYAIAYYFAERNRHKQMIEMQNISNKQ